MTMLPRQYMMLFGITITAFIFNTSEFMPIALLIDISESFSMTEAATGQMITIYAWVVALLSLPLMLLTCRMELKRLLLLMVALFGIGQLVSGLASIYDMLLGARIIVACAHSIFWSIAAPLATRLVTREHRPMALGMIVTGSSVATIVGLPLGRVIGLAAGWRMTFLLLAVVAVIAFVYLGILLPKRAPGEGFTIGELPSLVLHDVQLHRAVPAQCCGVLARSDHSRAHAARGQRHPREPRFLQDVWKATLFPAALVPCWGRGSALPLAGGIHLRRHDDRAHDGARDTRNALQHDVPGGGARHRPARRIDRRDGDLLGHLQPRHRQRNVPRRARGGGRPPCPHRLHRRGDCRYRRPALPLRLCECRAGEINEKDNGATERKANFVQLPHYYL